MIAMRYELVDGDGECWGYALDIAAAKAACRRPGDTFRRLKRRAGFEERESGLRTDAATGTREEGRPFVAIY